MSPKFQMTNSEFRVPIFSTGGSERRFIRHSPFLPRCFSIENQKSKIGNGRAFTLIEVIVVAALLALIILALMTVFNGTQAAFRAGITQTGVLESGRAVSDLIKSDLETMTPARGLTYGSYYMNCGNANFIVTNGAANFYVAVTNYTYPLPPSPLFQSLVGVNDPNTRRTNVLENFFILSRGNMNGSDSWIGTGYAVYVSPTNLYSLYRFSTNHPVMTTDPMFIFTNDFRYFLLAITNGSHLMDGVVHLTVHAFDVNGAPIYFIGTNIMTIPPNFLCPGIVREPIGYVFYSNALPASVEVELGVLEDRTLQRAESLPNLPPIYAQTAYLSNHVGQVHVFRQRAWIRNVDPSAYYQ